MTEDELKRQAQMGMLAPTSNTMPVGQAPVLTGGAPDPLWSRGEIRGGARAGADFNRLAGGFGNADTDSMKHTFGRLAQNFEHTPAGLQSLIADPEFRQLFPRATLNNDWIDFGGQVDPHTGTAVGKVDVMRAFDPTANSGTGWQWLTEAEALNGGGTPAASPRATTGYDALSDNSTIARILAELTAASNDDQSPAEREAVLAALQGSL